MQTEIQHPPYDHFRTTQLKNRETLNALKKKPLSQCCSLDQNVLHFLLYIACLKPTSSLCCSAYELMLDFQMHITVTFTKNIQSLHVIYFFIFQEKVTIMEISSECPKYFMRG